MAERPCRVLIVDDSPEDREAYRRSLASGPDACAVTACESGEEGLSQCRSGRPDCALLDYNLPDMDGLEFLTRVRAELGEDAVAVVMLTGQGSETVAVEALKQGAQDYLVKGRVSGEDLRRVVHAAVEKVRLRRQVEEQRRELERAAAALRASEGRFRQIAEAMPQIVWTTTPDGYHDYYNGRWYEYTGMPRGQGEGWNWKDYLHPDDVDRTLAVWDR